MSGIWSRLRQLYRDDDGAALIEYTVLLGMILGAVLITVIAVAGWVTGQWTTFNGLVNP